MLCENESKRWATFSLGPIKFPDFKHLLKFANSSLAGKLKLLVGWKPCYEVKIVFYTEHCIWVLFVGKYFVTFHMLVTTTASKATSA